MIVPKSGVTLALGLALLTGVDSLPEALVVKRQEVSGGSSGMWSCLGHAFLRAYKDVKKKRPLINSCLHSAHGFECADCISLSLRRRLVHSVSQSFRKSVRKDKYIPLFDGTLPQSHHPLYTS
jgi:hypothetical protein